MKYYIILIILALFLNIGAQQAQPVQTTPQTNVVAGEDYDATVDPMRPDFGGILKKKKIKHKEKNKIFSENILKSNKKLYKTTGR